MPEDEASVGLLTGTGEGRQAGDDSPYPLVSIIIPTYNRASFLREAVDSALSQTYPNLEVIVVDDGSTDETGAVLSEYAGQVHAVYQGNRGLPAARNVGVEASQGQFLVFLDSDDLLLPTKIQSQVEYLVTRPDIGVVYGDGYIMNEDGLADSLEPYMAASHPVSDDAFVRSLLLQNQLVVHAALVRRAVLPDKQVFDESLTRFEDWDLWLRMCLTGVKFAYRDEKTVVYRRHSGNFDMDDVTACRNAAARILLRIVCDDLDSHLGATDRQNVRLYHMDLLTEYGSWADILKVVRDIVRADNGFSLRASQVLLFGRGPRPDNGPRWARSLPVLISRRWISRRLWQQARSARYALAPRIATLRTRLTSSIR